MFKNAPHRSISSNYVWTAHAAMKMAFYGLSEQRVKRVVKSPTRREEGIAPGTIAVMQPASLSTKNGKRIWKQEIWVMYKLTNDSSRRWRGRQKTIDNEKRTTDESRRILDILGEKAKTKIISAWRYPGVTKPGEPLPQAIIDEMMEAED